MNRQRRDFNVLAGLTLLGMGSMATYAKAQPSAQLIKISAEKFEFKPNTLTLKQGVPVILEFTTSEVVMGFNAPGLGVRTDIIPGKPVQLPLRPDATGTFAFFCDIFCGSGHENMNGTLIVNA